RIDVLDRRSGLDRLSLARAGRRARRRYGAADGKRRSAAADEHFGLHGRPAARVPDPPAPYVNDSCHAFATSETLETGASSRARATRRMRSFWFSSVTYSTGDLPSTRASRSAGSSDAVRASTPSNGMPSRYAPDKASKQRRKPAFACGVHRHFSSR